MGTDLLMEIIYSDFPLVISPIFETENQKVIANLMSHPFCFGGSNFRNSNFKGFVDSLYLGAFKRSFLKDNHIKFDNIHPDISEDSDLNYRLIQSGGKVYMDPDIVVHHLPRESLRSFMKLCFNYGVGRGIFICKHKKFPAIRQLIPIVSFFIGLLLLSLSFTNTNAMFSLISLISIYVILVCFFSIKISSLNLFTKYFIGFIGSHFYWTLGMIFSPIKYYRNLKNYKKSI